MGARLRGPLALGAWAAGFAAVAGVMHVTVGSERLVVHKRLYDWMCGVRCLELTHPVAVRVSYDDKFSCACVRCAVRVGN